MDNKQIVIRKIALTSLFSATAIGLGYALAPIPNVELITATLFLSGYILSWKYGIYSAVITYLVFSIFNPFGFSHPLLLSAQIIGGITAVIAGNISRKYKNLIIFILSGFLITLFYDVITNIAGYLVFVSEQTLIVYIAGGIIFCLIHIISNIFIFGLILFPLQRLFEKLAI